MIGLAFTLSMVGIVVALIYKHTKSPMLLWLFWPVVIIACWAVLVS